THFHGPLFFAGRGVERDQLVVERAEEDRATGNRNPAVVRAAARGAHGPVLVLVLPQHFLGPQIERPDDVVGRPGRGDVHGAVDDGRRVRGAARPPGPVRVDRPRAQTRD